MTIEIGYTFPTKGTEYTDDVWDASHSFKEISDCACWFNYRRHYYPYPSSHKLTHRGFSFVENNDTTETDDFYAAHIAINTLLLGRTRA